MKTLRLFMLMAVMMCSLAVNAQDAIANDDSSTATSTVLENFDSETMCEGFTLQQHNDSLISDAELLKSIDKDSSAKRLRKAKIMKRTAWVGGSVLFLASAYCLWGTAFVAYYNGNGTGVNLFAIGAAAFFGASVAWTTSFLVAAHRQKKMALSANTSTPLMQFNLTKGKNSAVYANINILNDNMTNRKTLGLGFNFSF